MQILSVIKLWGPNQMKNQRKFKVLFKRLISGVSAIALSVGLLASIPASADDSNIGYKYTLFAFSSEDGAISSSAANFCVNGNIATNGTISAGQNFNVNGEKKEHTNEAMPDLTKAVNEKFFTENVDVKAENYKNEDENTGYSYNGHHIPAYCRSRCPDINNK